MNKKIKKFLLGYFDLFRYTYSGSVNFLKIQASIVKMIIILGLIGVSRNLLEFLFGGSWARYWFALTPDVFLVMFIGPVFLTFFSSVLLHFFSNGSGLKVEMKKILSVVFFLQILHIFIPFFDGLADFFSIPFRIYHSTDLYIKMILSPVALTPLILFFTWPTSLGIEISWIFVTFVLLKLYIKQFKFPLLKSLAVLSVTFYVTYMSIYPTYFFFLNESVHGSNYVFGLFFIFLTIPSVLYCKKVMKKENSK